MEYKCCRLLACVQIVVCNVEYLFDSGQCVRHFLLHIVNS